MKKHFLIWGILVGILVGMVENLVAGKNAWAMIEDVDGTKWYSTAELLEMAAETGENKLFSQFDITGINVKENKIRILLQDEVAMGFMMPSEKTIFKEIGIMQYYCETDEECGAKFWEIMDYVISGKPMESAVALYQNKNETDEQTMTVGEEFEVELAELEDDRLGLKTGEFQVYMIGNNTNSVGGVLYRDCLESPEYEEGMWCQKMVSEMMNIKYVPVWEETTTDESEDEDKSVVLDDGENNLGGNETYTEVEETKTDIVETVKNTPTPAEEPKYVAVIEDGGWEDENWENGWGEDDDSWEDILGPENFDDVEEELEKLEISEKSETSENLVNNLVSNSYQKYQLAGVAAVVIAAFSFLFLFFGKKLRKKSEKTLDNLENMI